VPPPSERRCAAIGQVRLQDNACVDGGELGLAQDRDEGVNREIEVTEFFHVKVDKGGRCRCTGCSIERAEALSHAPNAVVERKDVEVGNDCRHLHRDIIDVGAGDLREHRGETFISLGVRENRLTKRVHVEPDPLACTASQVPTENRLVGAQHNPRCLRANAPDNQWHDDGRKAGRHERTDSQHEAIDRAHLARREFPHQFCETLRCHGRIVEAQHLVGERQDQLATVVIGEQATEALTPPALLLRLVSQADHEQAPGEVDRTHGLLIVGGHHRSRG
jgi:hypothetical protein